MLLGVGKPGPQFMGPSAGPHIGPGVLDPELPEGECAKLPELGPQGTSGGGAPPGVEGGPGEAPWYAGNPGVPGPGRMPSWDPGPQGPDCKKVGPFQAGPGSSRAMSPSLGHNLYWNLSEDGDNSEIRGRDFNLVDAGICPMLLLSL
jgi:hypothetical protein